MTAADQLMFTAGRERGIALSYLARARMARGDTRSLLVRLAREAGRESIRYLKAARGAS